MRASRTTSPGSMPALDVVMSTTGGVRSGRVTYSARGGAVVGLLFGAASPGTHPPRTSSRGRIIASRHIGPFQHGPGTPCYRASPLWTVCRGRVGGSTPAQVTAGAQSRPIQVATLPSASAGVHHAGACSSVTRCPPAATAAATRASAWSCGTETSMWIRLRRAAARPSPGTRTTDRSRAGRRGLRHPTPPGYFALPILYGDRLVGKLDAIADRKAGVLRVHAIHQDVPFTKTVTAAVGHEIKDLAHRLELDLTPPG
ncbi:MAG: hypothetical protein GEV28_01925 [Actinophytocola sp.]|nr:hypothetical protein [Actinophytocola sp.]